MISFVWQCEAVKNEWKEIFQQQFVRNKNYERHAKGVKRFVGNYA